jgi:CBS domain-containing protein
MNKTAREVMAGSAECVSSESTIREAAKQLASLDVGALPICGEDDRLKGMLTDRDIVVKVLAAGSDPDAVTAGEFGEGKPVTIGADDSLEEAIATMKQHAVRRLPVIDEHRLVGVISQADIATAAGNDEAGGLVEAISAE